MKVRRLTSTTTAPHPGAPCPILTDERKELGRGRSGVVYLERAEDGRQLACKVFDSHGLTKLVQVVLLGAPNPYVWNEDAVRCAVLRRQILEQLVPVFSQGGVRVATAYDHEWNVESASYEMRTEFVNGRPAWLHHPLRMTGHDEARELHEEIMRPLQENLLAAGFDGLVWQAGKGNPVALNNFLREASGTWVWIDLESGVPALFPLNPLALLRFYLPRAWRFGRPMFDDVDTHRLNGYLSEHADDIEQQLGRSGAAKLMEQASELEQRQGAWKTLRRHEQSIGYRLARGRIDRATADWYRSRPLRWYARELTAATRTAVKLARNGFIAAPLWLSRVLGSIDVRSSIKAAWRFSTSQKHRACIARKFMAQRIDVWRERGQMNSADADQLRGHLDSEESGAYLTDFGVHLMIKPFVKVLEFWVFPGLFAIGVINAGTLALLVLGSGAVARTLYTLGRLIQSTLDRREKPWVALGVGVLPVLGNFAYPLQIFYSSTEEEDDLARFILHDGFARIGQHLPIWGGRDTLTEHVLNRLPDRIFGRRHGGAPSAP